MPSNSFPPTLTTTNPFAVQAIGYDGLFTVLFDDVDNGFKIFDSSDAATYISFLITDVAARHNGILEFGAFGAINLFAPSVIFGASGKLCWFDFTAPVDGVFTFRDNNDLPIFSSNHQFYDNAGAPAFLLNDGQMVMESALQVAPAGLQSGDGSTGINASITTAALVGKTITVKDGIITGFA